MVALTRDGFAGTLTPDADLRRTLLGDEVLRHPAKQSLPQLYHLLRRFAVPGGLLVDPFGGSGSAMIAAGNPFGMYVVTVELARHFHAMQQRAWEHFRCSIDMQDCYDVPPGDYWPMLGDSRDLVGTLVANGVELPCADLVITSPSYGGSEAVDQRKKQNATIAAHGGGNAAKQGYRASQPLGENTHISFVRDEGGYKNIQHHHGGRLHRAGYADDPPVDLVITSPPYQDALHHDQVGAAIKRIRAERGDKANSQVSTPQHYGVVDTVITSPPYADAVNHEHRRQNDAQRLTEGKIPVSTLRHLSPNSMMTMGGYDTDRRNIGYEHGAAYLASMEAVWRGCAQLLKPGGILCCITRDCVRNGKIVPVGQQNRDLLTAAGLELLEVERWHVDRLSFWRILQKRKNPNAPVIDTEEVSIFQKEAQP